MRSQMQARLRATRRRQRLQIGGGTLVVAAIWTVALWPSAGDEADPLPTSAPPVAFTPWTRGTYPGSSPTPSAESSIPTVLASTVPTVGASGAGPSGRVGRDAVRTPSTSTTTGATAPPATATAAMTTKGPKPGNGTGKPSKPTQQPSPTSTGDGFDLFDIFGL